MNLNCAKIYQKSNENCPVLKDRDAMRETFSSNQLGIDGDRGTTLGMNIYVLPALLQSQVSVSPPKMNAPDSIENENCQVLEEITLLGRLIGKGSQSDYVPDIILSANDDKEDLYPGASNNCSYSVVNIHASQ
ncbi:uncharacterized protein CEXT_206411, partial [Caerostris extrusa]